MNKRLLLRIATVICMSISVMFAVQDMLWLMKMNLHG